MAGDAHGEITILTDRGQRQKLGDSRTAEL